MAAHIHFVSPASGRSISNSFLEISPPLSSIGWFAKLCPYLQIQYGVLRGGIGLGESIWSRQLNQDLCSVSEPLVPAELGSGQLGPAVLMKRELTWSHLEPCPKTQTWGDLGDTV